MPDQVFIVLAIHNFEYNQEVARVEGSGIYDMVVLLAKNLKSGRKKHPSWCFSLVSYVLMYYYTIGIVEKNFAHSCWTVASCLGNPNTLFFDGETKLMPGGTSCEVVRFWAVKLVGMLPN